MSSSRNEGDPRAARLREVFKLYPKMHDTVVPALLSFAPKPITQTTEENAVALAKLLHDAATAFIITEKPILQNKLSEFFIDNLETTFTALAGDDETLLKASIQAYGELLTRGLPARPQLPMSFQAYFTHRRKPASDAAPPASKQEQLTTLLGNTVYSSLPLLDALAAFEVKTNDADTPATQLVEFVFSTIANQNIVIAKTSLSKAWLTPKHDGIIEILAGDDGALLLAAKQLSHERIAKEYEDAPTERISK